MPNIVKHYHPNALLLFVRGFQGKPSENDVLIAHNANDVKEVISINVQLTVRKNPGSFNAVISDTNHRFMDYDNLDEEISQLYKYSNSKKIIASKSVSEGNNSASGEVSEEKMGNYYGFTDFNNWKNHNNYTLIDTERKVRIPLYSKVVSNQIIEMWSYDDLGNFINIDKISDIIDNDVFRYKGKSYNIEKHKNEEFTTKYKDFNTQGVDEKTYLMGKCKIKSMDRVMIFMTERFPTYDNPEGQYHNMIRVFTGVVNTVQVDYAPGRSTISIQGEDVTKFLKTSYINVNPGLLIDSNRVVDQAVDEKITVWTTILKGLDAVQIIKLMLLGSDISGVKTKNDQKVDGVGLYTVSDSMPVGRRIQYDGLSNTFVEIIDSKTTAGGEPVRKASIKQILGQLFTQSTVHIVNPYEGKSKASGFRAYELSLNNSWSFYQAEFKTRREICDRVAEDTHFIFYADRYGEIWFHPPRFDNNWILGHANPDIYIIDTPSILSYGFIDTEENIYSSVYVTTEPSFGLEGLGFLTTSSFRDDGIALKYGQRIFTHSNPLVSFGENKTDDKNLRMYAKSLLQRLISGKYQGQITLTGRAEIDPGRPVYIPVINMIYYVETVDQALTFGDKHTTTLSLSYGRKPYEFIPELLDFGDNDEIYMTDAYLYRDYEATRSGGDDYKEGGPKTPAKYNATNPYLDVVELVVSDDYISKLALYEEYVTLANRTYPKVPKNVIRSIIIQESKVNPNAVSSAGAKGLMQLMPATAADMGVTSIFDPKQNIMGGTKYFNIQLNSFNNDIKLALAAYNAGPANVVKYNGVPPFSETKQYVDRVRGYRKNLDKRGY